MDFGPSTYYVCPFCKKPMRKDNLISYTTRGRVTFRSDGDSTGGQIFTPEFAKCPMCSALFFQKDLKVLKNFSNSNVRNIKTPDSQDLIKAIKKGIAKDWKEELQIRNDLWYAFYPERGGWRESPDDKDYLFWKENCAALIPLFKKNLKSIKYTEEHIGRLVQIAELYRNLGKFNECMKILNKLPASWKWLTKQFGWKCKAKDTFTFNIIKKSEMKLEKDEYAEGEEYYERGCKYLSFGIPKKALADFNKAEEKGLPDYFYDSFYEARGELYLNEFNDYDKAITDFSKALNILQEDEYGHRGRARIFFGRALAYKNIGNLKNALKDINNAIENDYESFICDKCHILRRDIYNEMGKTEDAMRDNFKYELVKYSWLAIDKKLEKKDKPFFYSTESRYKLTANKSNDKITLIFNEREGKPDNPEILYSGGENALLRRNYNQFILLEKISEKMRNILTCSMAESNMQACDMFIKIHEIIITESKAGKTKNEYIAPVRLVSAPLESLTSIILSGYPFLTGLRAHVYANVNKPIKKIIGKEDINALACILACEEDYTQLERFAAEGLPLDENGPRWLNKFCPTPLFYITCCSWEKMNDPVKMLKWLLDHGADINNISNNMTPLGNQCRKDGNYNVMKVLLENGADPNINVYDNYISTNPLFMLSDIADYDTNPGLNKKEKSKIEKNYSKEEINNMKKLAALLREYGAKEKEVEPEPDLTKNESVYDNMLIYIWLGKFNSEEEVDKFGKKAKKIINNLNWNYFDFEISLLDMLNTLSSDASIVHAACINKSPELENANTIFTVYRWGDEEYDIDITETTITNPNLFYIGDFGHAEKDTDGQYDAWV